MKKLLILAITLCSSLFTVDAADKKDLVDYVNPLVGSQSKISLSTGNTYPWFQADSPTQPLDQRLRTVCHYARYR